MLQPVLRPGTTSTSFNESHTTEMDSNGVNYDVVDNISHHTDRENSQSLRPDFSFQLKAKISVKAKTETAKDTRTQFTLSPSGCKLAYSREASLPSF